MDSHVNKLQEALGGNIEPQHSQGASTAFARMREGVDQYRTYWDPGIRMSGQAVEWQMLSIGRLDVGVPRIHRAADAKPHGVEPLEERRNRRVQLRGYSPPVSDTGDVFSTQLERFLSLLGM